VPCTDAAPVVETEGKQKQPQLRCVIEAISKFARGPNYEAAFPFRLVSHSKSPSSLDSIRNDSIRIMAGSLDIDFLGCIVRCA